LSRLVGWTGAAVDGLGEGLAVVNYECDPRESSRLSRSEKVGNLNPPRGGFPKNFISNLRSERDEEKVSRSALNISERATQPHSISNQNLVGIARREKVEQATLRFSLQLLGTAALIHHSKVLFLLFPMSKAKTNENQIKILSCSFC
jgi:hypothetical protein